MAAISSGQQVLSAAQSWASKQKVDLGALSNVQKQAVIADVAQQTGLPRSAVLGLQRRDDRDVCEAVFVPGQGEFTGTAATHRFDEGAVILRQWDSKADDWGYHLIQPDVFGHTYSNKDGTPIDLDRLPRGA